MYTITQSRLLYVLSINDRIHRGLLKIGEVFVDNEVADNPSQHAKTVREILNERPYMLGITYNLDYHLRNYSFRFAITFNGFCHHAIFFFSCLI